MKIPDEKLKGWVCSLFELSSDKWFDYEDEFKALAGLIIQAAAPAAPAVGELAGLIERLKEYARAHKDCSTGPAQEACILVIEAAAALSALSQEWIAVKLRNVVQSTLAGQPIKQAWNEIMQDGKFTLDEPAAPAAPNATPREAHQGECESMLSDNADDPRCAPSVAREFARRCDNLERELAAVVAPAKVGMSEEEIIKTISEAGAGEKEWKALTYKSGPYDVTCTTVFTEKFVERIRAHIAQGKGE